MGVLFVVVVEVMNRLSDLDVVSEGKRVYITYQDLKDTPAVVRSVMDRKRGILSVRILHGDMPQPHAYLTDPADGLIALVVVAGEWELAKS